MMGRLWVVVAPILLATTLVACSSVDDIGRAASRAAVSRSRAVTALDDIASVSGRSSDDLASILSRSDDSARVLDDLWASMRSAAGEASKSLLCDVLADAALDPGITAEEFEDMLLGALLGLTSSELATVMDVLSDMEDGTAASPMWSRVFLLKLRHC